MSIELVDDTGQPVDLDKASGGFLRTKLEEAIEQNKDLEKQVTTSRAVEVIGKNGYGLVEPGDLVGVPPDQVEVKAKELQEQRIGARTDAVRSVLVERGLKDEELESTLQGVLGDSGKPAPVPDSDPAFAGLSKIGGSRPEAKGDMPPMDDSLGNLAGHFTDQQK